MPEPLPITVATGYEPNAADLVRGYRVVLWKTFENYECLTCQYSTLWVEKMEKHQAESDHPWSYPNPTAEDHLSELTPGEKLEY